MGPGGSVVAATSPCPIFRRLNHDTPDSDRQLREAMAGYQLGDREAFERLYAHVAPALKRCLLSLAREPARVDDLLQETFLQIHRARHTYDPSYPVMPWVVAIARHVFLMDRRYRNRRHEFARQPFEAAFEKIVEPHDRAIVTRAGLKHALGELGATTREALLLRHVCGMSFDDISRRLKVGNPALRCRTSRAVARLRELLERKG